MSIVYDSLKKIHDQKKPEKAGPMILPERKFFGAVLWGKVAVGILGGLAMGAGLYFLLTKFE
jgi:hypothetical protein